MMEQSYIDEYNESMADARRYCQWHPWAQVIVWISDWEFYHEWGSWTFSEMRDWIKQQLKENQAMVKEVNANPLHEGLIYPDKISWVSYVLHEMCKVGWLSYDTRLKTYHSDFVDFYDYPAEWLASQIQGQVSFEMANRGMEFDSNGYKPKCDLGYSRKWEELVEMGLIGAPQWTW